MAFRLYLMDFGGLSKLFIGRSLNQKRFLRNRPWQVWQWLLVGMAYFNWFFDLLNTKVCCACGTMSPKRSIIIKHFVFRPGHHTLNQLTKPCLKYIRCDWYPVSNSMVSFFNQIQPKTMRYIVCDEYIEPNLFTSFFCIPKIKWFFSSSLPQHWPRQLHMARLRPPPMSAIFSLLHCCCYSTLLMSTSTRYEKMGQILFAGRPIPLLNTTNEFAFGFNEWFMAKINKRDFTIFFLSFSLYVRTLPFDVVASYVSDFLNIYMRRVEATIATTTDQESEGKMWKIGWAHAHCSSVECCTTDVVVNAPNIKSACQRPELHMCAICRPSSERHLRVMRLMRIYLLCLALPTDSDDWTIRSQIQIYTHNEIVW